MPSALIAASASATWSAYSRRHGRCASCRRSGRLASALSALLRLNSSLPHCTPSMLSVARIFRPGTDSFSAVSRLILLDDDVAGGGAMKPPLAGRDHVERHHAAEHAPPRQSFAQHGEVADAVLQADDDRIRRRVSRMMSAMSAVSALFTVTSTTAASPKAKDFPTMRACRRERLIGRRQSSSAAGRLSRSRRSRAAAPAAPRGLPPAASMPPTKQPMLPAPATPIGTVRSFAFILRIPGLDSRSGGRCLSKRAPAAPCNRHGPPLCFAFGGSSAEEKTMGLLDVLNGMQNGPRGPSAPSDPKPTAAAACRR